jgi:dGTPase
LPEHDDRIWDTGEDQRNPFQRDRDRILYSTAFRRLAGVTQVIAPTEGHIFHNRLTHSLEVAQIARRLAERLRAEFPEQSKALDNLNADVAEAAALAHDLGHPPFGHVAEQELNRLVRDVGCLQDGYEGNAQSFRTVTKLSVRQNWQKTARNKPSIESRRGEYGLNLTRATLNGILKYPRLWAPDGPASHKWGVFDTEEPEFRWARELAPEGELQSVEAAVMDWADDIAYSIHDTEDFYRAGLIPIDRLAVSKDERLAFLSAVFERFKSERTPFSVDDKHRLTDAFHAFATGLTVTERYTGTPSQQLALHSFTARKIGELILSTKLTADPKKPLKIPQLLKDQVKIVKQLVWQYVIVDPRLATQQHGYAIIIRKLFETYLDASNHGPKAWRILPPRFRQVLDDWREFYGNDMPKARMVRNVADTVASLTDNEAVVLYKRLAGIAPGSIADLLPS